MKPKKILLELTLAYLLMVNAAALSVGTSPGVYDLGELDPGTNVAFRFYLMTNSQNDILVSLSYIPVHYDMYQKSVTSSYRFIAEEASQEDISSWVEIVRNPLLLSPEKVMVVNVPGGGTIKANEEVDIILHIPENADPGYHAGSINLAPQTASGGRGTGVMTIAVTRFIFVFRISGEAKREGEIMTILGERLEENKAKIDVLFKNTGTCTLYSRVTELNIYDKFGKSVATLHSGMILVHPNMIEPLTAYWTGNVKPGTYRVEAKVDYITGYDTMEASLEIPTTIKVKPSKPISPIPSEFSLCKHLPYLIMVLIIAALLIYWLDWKQKGTALLLIAALSLISIALFVFTCIISIGLSWLDILFIIIILSLIIYWRLS